MARSGLPDMERPQHVRPKSTVLLVLLQAAAIQDAWDLLTRRDMDTAGTLDV
jgi:hypothetical protein